MKFFKFILIGLILILQSCEYEYDFDVIEDAYTYTNISRYNIIETDFIQKVIIPNHPRNDEMGGDWWGMYDVYYNIQELDANGNEIKSYNTNRPKSHTMFTKARSIHVKLELTSNKAVGEKGEVIATYDIINPITLGGNMKTYDLTISSDLLYTEKYSDTALKSYYTVSDVFTDDVIVPILKEENHTIYGIWGVFDLYYKVKELDSERNIIKQYSTETISKHTYETEADYIDISIEIVDHRKPEEVLHTFHFTDLFELPHIYKKLDIELNSSLPYEHIPNTSCISYYTVSDVFTDDVIVPILKEENHTIYGIWGVFDLYYTVKELDSKGNLLYTYSTERISQHTYETEADYIDICIEVTKLGAVGIKGEVLHTFHFTDNFVLPHRYQKLDIKLNSSLPYEQY